jgi:hypothetical protein
MAVLDSIERGPDPFQSQQVGLPKSPERFASHDAGRVCICVKNHTPEPQELTGHHIHPLGMGGPDVPGNVVWLCPTSHYNVHEVLREWIRYKGEPPWDEDRRGFIGRKRFSPYIRDLAKEGFRRVCLSRSGI